MNLFKISFFILIIASFVSCKQTGERSEVDKSEEGKTETARSIDTAAFFKAALEGNTALVLTTLTEGVDVNMVEDGNRTATMLAAFNGHVEVLELLIKYGADVNMVDVNNRTALMFAATGPFIEAVKVLLAAGADANVIDNGEHWTALMFAAAEGQTEVVMALIENGAEINLADIDGETAYDFALAQGHKDIAEYILNSKELKKHE